MQFSPMHVPNVTKGNGNLLEAVANRNRAGDFSSLLDPTCCKVSSKYGVSSQHSGVTSSITHSKIHDR